MSLSKILDFVLLAEDSQQGSAKVTRLRRTLHDGVNGTSLLAEPTIDALGHIDIYGDN